MALVILFTATTIHDARADFKVFIQVIICYRNYYQRLVQSPVYNY